MPHSAASHDFPCHSCEVRDTAICRALTDRELRELSAIATSVELAEGKAAFYEGDENTYLFNVVTGAVRLTKLLPDGRRQVTGFLFPGDFLGLSVATDTYAYSAETLSETSLCRFKRVGLIKLLDRFPKLERQLLERASNELLEAQAHLVILGQKFAAERLSATLLNLMERIGRTGKDGIVLELPMGRADLADYAGMRIETVSRCLRRLQIEGIINLSSARCVRIRQPEELARLAGD